MDNHLADRTAPERLFPSDRRASRFSINYVAYLQCADRSPPLWKNRIRTKTEAPRGKFTTLNWVFVGVSRTNLTRDAKDDSLDLKSSSLTVLKDLDLVLPLFLNINLINYKKSRLVSFFIIWCLCSWAKSQWDKYGTGTHLRVQSVIVTG